ncbi:hypothetical protein [Methylophilus sp. DW102]|uniref:hypothetical protein n=1 Tax=Methylophilus sp. DW102 TaxID=3095607 RepID=UPI00308DD161|nr:hypothetical protein MTDW_02360 [Methylophilus sp. DW102]
MKPTATAKRVFYTPPCEPDSGAVVHPNDEALTYDCWHVEMESIDGGYAWVSSAGSFKTEAEAKGFMAGWNAHRTQVAETLFKEKFRGRK